MKKIGSLIIIFVLVVLAYIIIIVTQPTVNQMVSTANASANWTNYPEAQAVLLGWPFWVYFIPAAIGMVAVVVTLRKEN